MWPRALKVFSFIHRNAFLSPMISHQQCVFISKKPTKPPKAKKVKLTVADKTQDKTKPPNIPPLTSISSPIRTSTPEKSKNIQMKSIESPGTSKKPSPIKPGTIEASYLTEYEDRRIVNFSFS